jgi:hypothetical protein
MQPDFHALPLAQTEGGARAILMIDPAPETGIAGRPSASSYPAEGATSPRSRRALRRARVRLVVKPAGWRQKGDTTATSAAERKRKAAVLFSRRAGNGEKRREERSWGEPTGVLVFLFGYSLIPENGSSSTGLMRRN